VRDGLSLVLSCFRQFSSGMVVLFQQERSGSEALFFQRKRSESEALFLEVCPSVSWSYGVLLMPRFVYAKNSCPF